EAAPAGPAPRVCLPAAPERLLFCALALELAGALAAEQGSARVEASFALSPLLPEVPGVRLGAAERSPAELASALDAIPAHEPALALVRPEQLGELVRRAGRTLDALLVPVDGSAAGVVRALRLLREISPALAGVRVFAWVVAARSAPEGAALGERLASAARRQHGLAVEVAPALPHDPALFRALLHGQSVHTSDDGSGAGARELRALSRSLAARRAA
ncbi:MAG TPA: hypothetical protein VEI82_03410, partial [Myxococcota bacterium]|nr:hypothetical protein [Myxococcota bacterium]